MEILLHVCLLLVHAWKGMEVLFHVHAWKGMEILLHVCLLHVQAWKGMGVLLHVFWLVRLPTCPRGALRHVQPEPPRGRELLESRAAAPPGAGATSGRTARPPQRNAGPFAPARNRHGSPARSPDRNLPRNAERRLGPDCGVLNSDAVQTDNEAESKGRGLINFRVPYGTQLGRRCKRSKNPLMIMHALFGWQRSDNQAVVSVRSSTRDPVCSRGTRRARQASALFLKMIPEQSPNQRF